MQHILVPIGSTKSAKNTLQYAIDFASKINAKVLVFRAYSALTKAGTIIDIDSIIVRETNLYLKTLLEAVNTKNVDVKLVTAKGATVESVESIDADLGIDLIIVGAKSNSEKNDIFLGKTAGSLVRKTQIPVLTVPDGYKFSSVKNILMSFKSGVIDDPSILKPLNFIAKIFSPEIDMLLVKTPDFIEGDHTLNEELLSLKSNLIESENSNTFKAVLEQLQQKSKPDMICVFRRKRGFFNKLWVKNSVLKSEFYADLPLLILKGK